MMTYLKEIPARGTVKWEAMRVAAAFGVGEYSLVVDRPESVEYLGYDAQGLLIEFSFWPQLQKERLISVENAFWDEADDSAHPSESNPAYNEALARGLYRLSVSEHALSQLPTLSAHEQMEARLSLPREFWPPQWEKECQTPA